MIVHYDRLTSKYHCIRKILAIYARNNFAIYVEFSDAMMLAGGQILFFTNFLENDFERKKFLRKIQINPLVTKNLNVISKKRTFSFVSTHIPTFSRPKSFVCLGSYVFEQRI